MRCDAAWMASRYKQGRISRTAVGRSFSLRLCKGCSLRKEQQRLGCNRRVVKLPKEEIFLILLICTIAWLQSTLLCYLPEREES
jgi:hypothetical protein